MTPPVTRWQLYKLERLDLHCGARLQRGEFEFHGPGWGGGGDDLFW